MLYKNNKKLIYKLLAQIVWLSVETYGRKFTPSYEELPSYLPDKERDTADKNSINFLNLIKENGELKNKYDTLKESINLNKNKIKNSKDKIIELNSTLDENKLKCATLENNKNDLNKELFNQIEKNENNIKELNNTIDRQNDQINNLNIKLEKSNSKLNLKIKKTAKELEDRWYLAFDDFIFDRNVIKYVVKNFQYRDLSIIESRLKELKDSKDPYALRSNRGKMSDGQRVHIAFSTKAGFPCRIFYKALKKHDDNKRIEITEIQKHNYSRYGK